MADTDRLTALENAVRVLFREMESLRADVRALDGNGSRQARPADAEPLGTERPDASRASETAPATTRASSHAPDPSTRRHTPSPRRTKSAWSPGADLESLIGRYGSVALATLAILMGTGVFLRWAVQHVRLGPELRVTLGALWAAAIAGVGIWLQRRGERRYGSVLLALALAVVHVDAWGAGPRLHVAPPVVALAVAALASIALAAFALREAHQTLFVVGIGGALLAPFVTADRGGDVRLLMTFGWVVTAAGLLAVRARPWNFSRRLLAVGATAYVVAGLAMLTKTDALSNVVAPALLGLVLAWTLLLVVTREYRRSYAVTFLGSALVGVAYLASESLGAYAVAGMAAMVTLTAYVTLRVSSGSDFQRTMLPAIVIPIASLTIALTSVPPPISRAALASGWTIAALVAAADACARGEERAMHLFVAGLASIGIAFFGLDARSFVAIAALCVHGVLVAILVRREQNLLIAVPGALSISIATIWVASLLLDRRAYAYTPFVGGGSLAALACVGVWWIYGWCVAHTEFDERQRLSASQRGIFNALGAAVAFLWGREELSRAYSADLASFLTILYYAAFGVAAIFIGRRSDMSIARRAGLAIAVYAAIKAVMQTSSASAVALRVASYMVAGCFLLAVAYWYRAASAGAPTPDAVRVDEARPLAADTSSSS